MASRKTNAVLLSEIGEIDQDSHFIKYGLIRPTVELRGLSQPVDMRQTPNAVFTFRALLGIGIRADVILYLLCSESGHARFIADYLGYNHMRVQKILHDLTATGMLSVHESGRIKDFSIDRDRWWGVIMNDASTPIWRNWRAFYRGMSAFMRKVLAIDADRADDYIAFSIIRNALEETRNDFYSFGGSTSISLNPEDGDWNAVRHILDALK